MDEAQAKARDKDKEGRRREQRRKNLEAGVSLETCKQRPDPPLKNLNQNALRLLIPAKLVDFITKILILDSQGLILINKLKVITLHLPKDGPLVVELGCTAWR